MTSSVNRTPNAATIKTAAAGKWLEILPAAGIPAELLDGQGHPCPKCGGTDRFAAMKDVAERGAVLCRGCFSKGGGDGLASVAWIRDIDFPAAVRFVAEFLNITPTDQTHVNNDQRRIVATYDYRDAAGNLAYQVVRYVPKDFRQRCPKPDGGWNWKNRGIEPLPYRLPELLAADPSQLVIIIEGERDADSLSRLGIIATTNHGGAGKWKKAHAQHLASRRVAIIPDADEPGEKHAQAVASSLQGIAASVRIVRLPGLPEKGDVSDWLRAGGTTDELQRLIDAAPEWTPEAQPWPVLRPFNAIELPPFPVDALPSELRQWVDAESEATQTPPALAALLSVGVCSACIARRVEVEPRPGWREPINLFILVQENPGGRKSVIFRDCTKPLREVEAELIEAERPAVARAQSDRRRTEAKLKRAEKLAVEKGDLEAGREADQLAEELAATPEVVYPRLIVDDATTEKLAVMLAEQGGRLVSMSPEGGPFDLMSGRYSKNGAVDVVVYLKGHAGDDIITDRVSRESVRVEKPALTCCYAVQPEVIRGLAGQSEFRGRGLLARFLYALPPSPVGRRRVATEPVPASIRDGYHAVIRRLFWSTRNNGSDSDQFAGDFPGDSENVESDYGPFILRLDNEAAQLMVQWETQIEGQLDDGGDMEAMRDWGSKLAGLTLRLAAVLHCVQHGPASEIGVNTLEDAISIGRWAIPHAEAALNLMAAGESSKQADALYVLRWIERHGRDNFTKSEAQHHGKRRFPRAEEIDPALAELVTRGYIRQRPTETTGPGRPPSPTYDVNPAAFADTKPDERSHNSHNSTGEPENGNSRNNGSASGQNTSRTQVTI